MRAPQRLAAALVVSALLSAGCGARLTRDQKLAFAAQHAPVRT